MRNVAILTNFVLWIRILLAPLIMFLFMSRMLTIASPADSSFLAGTQAYRNSDFERAAEAFRQSSSLHPASGALQNLGLAEWHNSRVGPAILAWEQALWLDPFNGAVRNNLRFARKAAQVDAPDLSWNEVISGWLPVNYWSWLISFSLWLAVGAVVIPMVLRLPRASWHQAVAAFGVMLFLLSLPAQFGVHTRTRLGFILEKGTPLRLTPTEEAQTITQLAPAEPVRCLRARGNFILVRTSRASGWIERNKVGLLCKQAGQKS